MDHFEKIADRMWYLAVYIISLFQNTPSWLSFGVGFLGISAWIIGGRFARFTKPGWPRMSPMLRIIGKIVWVIGFLIVITAVALFIFVMMLLFMYHYIVGYSTIAAIKAAWLVILRFLKSTLMHVITGFSFGVGASLILVWRVITAWDRGNGLQDVKGLVSNFVKLNGYDPLPYIKIKRGCFVGRAANGKPIYIPWHKLRETHTQVLGMTGSGKGVAMSLIAYQCVLAGECVTWFDPKHDRYASRILKAAAIRADRKFHIVNLNPEHGPQLNPLMDAKEHQIEELFVAAFDLRGRGTDADFYLGQAEDAAAEAARVAIETSQFSVPGLFKACSSIKSITGQENFWRHFRKLATLSAINTESGLNLSEALSRNDVIYFVGSADNERVKMLQKMILVRIMQIIKSRDRLAKHAPTCIVLDEFKHMLSVSAFTSLGVVRDFDVHILLAHQSMGDLRACPGIDPDEANGAVVDNTAIKIVYRIGDDEYAEKLSRISGSHRTYVDSSSKVLSEDGNDAGSWHEDKEQHISPDFFTHLPMPSDRPKQASVGVVLGIGNALPFFVGPVPVEGDMPVPVEAPAYTKNGSRPEEEVI